MDQRRTLFIALLLKGLQYSAAQYYLEIPKKLWAIKHSCVVIPCSYSYSNPKLSSGSIMGIWYHASDEHDKDKILIKSNTYESHASFIGDLGNGNCSIKIHNVQPENSKIYKFRVEMKHFRFSYNSVVRLNVLDDPPRPILVFPNQTMSEGAIVTLKCSTTYTCSSDFVDLVWSSYEGQLNVTRSYQDEEAWTVESKQVFQISRKHDGISVSCHANYSSGVKSEVVEGRKLTISYKPEILQRSQCKRHLSAIYCECAAIAKPPAIITWHNTDISITETPGFFIHSSSNSSETVSRLEGALMPPGGLWCTASNMEGSVSQNLPLYVDWTEPILIGGGILAFLILCIIGAVVAIRKGRSKKSQTLEPNSYIMADKKCNNDISTKKEVMMSCHANRDTKGVRGAVSYEDPDDIYANSVVQNENDNYSTEEIYVNVEEEKGDEEEDDEEEDGVYINC